MAIEFLTEQVGYIPGAVNVGVIRADGDRYILIDTGLNDTSGKKAVKAIQELGGTIASIVTTHAHADHFGANAGPMRRGVVMHAHDLDAGLKVRALTAVAKDDTKGRPPVRRGAAPADVVLAKGVLRHCSR